MEFAVWAAASPAERGAVLRDKAAIEAELRSCARMAAICGLAAGGVGSNMRVYEDSPQDRWCLQHGPQLEVARDRQTAVEELLRENQRVMARLHVV